ncbi:MAG: PHB depolymerase family esterase [Betaproteobacteria bacterium]
MLARLWERAKAWFLHHFPSEPEPGRFESGSSFSVRGFLASAPFVLPSREYLVYIPKGRSSWRRAPLIVLCHGCKQTPEEFAKGTRIAELADAKGFVVLLPRQKDNANPWRCWNWFDTSTMGGGGEAAIVAAQIRSVRRHYRCDRKRVLVAGMSAGGAFAAVMGLRYPGLVTAVAVHSGLACGAAKSPLSALVVMQSGPEQDVAAIGNVARAAAPPKALPIPLLAIQGSADAMVAPMNAVALVRQFLHLNGHASAQGGATPNPDLSAADTEKRTTLPNGRTEVVREWRSDGRLVARLVEVTGLGHAWSGGDPAQAYNDAEAPDATALVGAFFTDAIS